MAWGSDLKARMRGLKDKASDIFRKKPVDDLAYLRELNKKSAEANARVRNPERNAPIYQKDPSSSRVSIG